MGTISDFASILEAGFGLNVAASFVGAFINPLLARYNKELDRFRWWVEHPDKTKRVLKGEFTEADCEDRLVSWLRAYDNLEANVNKISQLPIAACAVAAVTLIILLLLPEMSVNGFGLAALVVIAFAPSLCGAVFVHTITSDLQRRVETQAKRANDLFK